MKEDPGEHNSTRHKDTLQAAKKFLMNLHSKLIQKNPNKYKEIKLDDSEYLCLQKKMEVKSPKNHYSTPSDFNPASGFNSQTSNSNSSHKKVPLAKSLKLSAFSPSPATAPNTSRKALPRDSILKQPRSISPVESIEVTPPREFEEGNLDSQIDSYTSQFNVTEMVNRQKTDRKNSPRKHNPLSGGKDIRDLRPPSMSPDKMLSKHSSHFDNNTSVIRLTSEIGGNVERPPSRKISFLKDSRQDNNLSPTQSPTFDENTKVSAPPISSHRKVSK